MQTHFKNPNDKALLAQCAAINPEAIPCKVWSPKGTYWVSSCATHEDIAGSFVADGMPQDEYWPMIANGYKQSLRHYLKAMLPNYTNEWESEYLSYMEN